MFLQESAHEKEKAHYCNLMQDIGWFFFDLLILGYIEDSTTGKSFQVPDLSWEMYVEVRLDSGYHSREYNMIIVAV